MTDILKSIARNHVFSTIIFLVVLMTGILAVTRMVKEDLPVMAHDMVEVSMEWPGADPVNIEEGILRKIEMATQGLEGIFDIRTIAQDSFGKALFTVAPGYDPQDVLERVKAQVDAISGFPENAKKPVIIQPLHSFAVMTLFISYDTDGDPGKGTGEKALKTSALAIRDDLVRLDTVSKVFIDGARQDEISVEISLADLQAYDLSIPDLARIVRSNSIEMSAGDIKGRDRSFTLRAMGKRATAEQIREIIAVTSPAGEQIPLASIAQVTDGFVQADAFVSINGRPGILINIHKTEKEDAVKISKAVRSYLAEKKAALLPGMEIGILFDASIATTDRINSLVKNGLYGLIFVLIILWMFIDARLAFWVAAGIPFSILGGLVILWLNSGTLNMVSLFSLIMVLGIIADDAIVMGEAILFHRKNGADSLDAVITGVKEVGLPVLVAVFTSVVAFMPLLFVQGMMGKFIAILPLTVIACLLISLVECFVLLPAHLNTSAHSGEGRGHWLNRLSGIAGRRLDAFIQKIYQPFLRRTIKNRYFTVSCGISLVFVTIGIVMGGFLPFDLFPDTQGSVITATIEFPVGTDIESTRQGVKKLNQALDRAAGRLKDREGKPVIVSKMSLSGHLLGDEAGEIEKSAAWYGSVQVVLVSARDRDIKATDILKQWQAHVPDIAGARQINFFSDSVGMPEAPIVIHLMGDHLDELARAGNHLKSYLEQFDAVYQVRSDLSENTRELQIELKPSARALGIDQATLSSQVKESYFGKKALTLQRGQEEVDVYVRLTRAERRDLSSLDRLKIRTGSNALVPLPAVASITPGTGLSRIERKNRQRKVSIYGYVRGEEATADQIMDQVEEDFMPGFRTRFPSISIAEGGDEEEENMTFDSLMYGFPMALIVIYMIIAATFKSYLKPFLILLVIPFGIAGAVLGHLLLGHMLSLMSIFGMVAVTGVLINDAIVLLDAVDAARNSGHSFRDAVIHGSVRRFRAVFLTSISTVAGLLPLIMDANPHIQLLIPMAVSIAGGIVCSTVITLVLVPGCMMICHDLESLFRSGVGTAGHPAAVDL